MGYAMLTTWLKKRHDEKEEETIQCASN